MMSTAVALTQEGKVGPNNQLSHPRGPWRKALAASVGSGKGPLSRMLARVGEHSVSPCRAKAGALLSPLPRIVRNMGRSLGPTYFNSLEKKLPAMCLAITGTCSGRSFRRRRSVGTGSGQGLRCSPVLWELSRAITSAQVQAMVRWTFEQSVLAKVQSQPGQAKSQRASRAVRRAACTQNGTPNLGQSYCKPNP